ncbi:hypothetical protein DICSQDRAFT_101358 [Dichomitus squalens LYAD-421 SS1]|uniref:Uncharacterized protein n=1 Tax=Dichomitus squalens TaxID=114155 RepID=A0A4Q9N2E2_9APHY|nr:uncharacterized protein DICSQDRAFT_101358 [Dichomitus squalens LYAD-421 SS1]EJF64441.1 hypothetical protein DICSQDRAFT_101358 [Dichomitus squalens LYAD-421 SS1]TBU34018.1 hypothetical protein BD311DRAFT_773907 [Dichomitus squalens]
MSPSLPSHLFGHACVLGGRSGRRQAGECQCRALRALEATTTGHRKSTPAALETLPITASSSTSPSPHGDCFPNSGSCTLDRSVRNEGAASFWPVQRAPERPWLLDSPFDLATCAQARRSPDPMSRSRMPIDDDEDEGGDWDFRAGNFDGDDAMGGGD